MANQRVGGLIQFSVDGTRYNAKGDFTYNPGGEKRSAVIGADGVHGYSVEHQVAFIEGAITVPGDLDVGAFVDFRGKTVTLQLGNGKVFALRDAWYAGEGTVNTKEGELSVRFEGKSGEEILA